MGLNPEFRSLQDTAHYPRAPIVVGALALCAVIAVVGWRVTQRVDSATGRPANSPVAEGVAGGLSSPIAPSGAAAPVDLSGAASDAIDIMPVSMAEHQARVYRLLAAAPLNFARHSAELPPSADGVLAEIARTLAGTDLLVRVRGHTDSEGLPEYRLELSRERAETVRGALILLGVSDERLLVEAMGAREPVASNADEEGRARNRRVDLVLREAHR